MHSMSCWFCRYEYTNRCGKSLALGTQQIDGGQAQFVRVPDADGTLLLAPPYMEDDLLVMMSDIFPTGYYGAMRAIEYFQQPGDQVPPTWSDSDGVKPVKRFFEKQPLSGTVFVCIGCGIVGLCGILTASVKGVGTVFCVDSVDDRLEQGQRWVARR
jgi:threonine dehydrogenase-like Zn-dependent dehydrogenase